MGQYWKPVNLDKREYINPHKLGVGLKLCEQVCSHPGTGAALLILCAAMPEVRGGGDLDLDENWHGTERVFPEHNLCPGPLSEGYRAIAHRTIGRWAGDRIAIVGDYAEDTDLAPEHRASTIYGRCVKREELSADDPGDAMLINLGLYTDITNDVLKVIEHELGGSFSKPDWGFTYHG